MVGVVLILRGCRDEERVKRRPKGDEERARERERQLSLLAFLMAALRRSVVGCRVAERRGVEASPAMALAHMEIGWPTDVHHVSHVTFDRFQGFVGLPVEFEVEIPCRVPSASASVFGVSAESMQCCFDSKGNSVPIILLLMQERLYSQGGLKAEGIFRINPENSKEEELREQLNKGIVPEDIEVHCLASLIKAWFRELPEGVLDGLSPEQVLQCDTEERCVELVHLLHPTQAALLNWAVELMADVVEVEELNKMNARNIAMVFAPNMTQMSDPLTALMHAVQVMNLLKSLILKILREREEASMGGISPSFSSQSSSDGCHDEEMHSDDREIASNDEYSSEYSSASSSPAAGGRRGDGGGGGGDDDDDDDDDDEQLKTVDEMFLGDSISNLTQLSFQKFSPEVSSCREIVLFEAHKQIGAGDLEI